MIKEQQFRVTPQVAHNEQNIIDYISREMGIDRRTVTHVRILKKSIDARQKQIYINLTLRIFINEEPADEEYTKTEYPEGQPAQYARADLPFRRLHCLRRGHVQKDR